MGGTSPFVVDLADAGSLEVGGGKAAGLATLIQSGIPVPTGVVLTPAAQRLHLQSLDLVGEADVASDQLNDALRSGRAVRDRILGSALPDAVRSAAVDAWNTLGGVPVAVRSSATVEDSPYLSFAGQLESVLDVRNADSLESAILTCWASFYTDRAIAYRHSAGIGRAGLGMGVIVQEMVPAVTAGVLFTADPLTGRRTEMVVEAVAGLGESLVGGTIEPDRYRIVTSSGRAQREGDLGRPPVLSDSLVHELWLLGQVVVEVCGGHQDIEWGVDDRGLWVLQARPITTLYPLPDHLPPDPLHVLISYAASQGMTRPITPRGRDAIRGVQAGSAQAFGFGPEDHPVQLVEAGERLWYDVTPMVRSRLGRRALTGLVSTLDPGARVGLLELHRDRRLSIADGLTPTTLWKALPQMAPIAGRLVSTIVRPDRERARFEAELERDITQRVDSIRTAIATSELDHVLAEALAFLLPRFIPRYWTGALAQILLHRLARKIPGGRQLVLTAAGGLEHNPTTDMNLRLWEVAVEVRADPVSRLRFESTSPEELARALASDELPSVAQRVVQAFLDDFGSRGPAEIDVGRPNWSDDPTPVMQILRGLVALEDLELAPDRRLDDAGRRAATAIDELALAFRRRPLGGLQSSLIHWLATRVRALVGLREAPKLYSVRLRGVTRERLLKEGSRLVGEGLLDQADDVFYLTARELGRSGSRDGWRPLVEERRARVRREERRARLPRVLLSDGQAFYEQIPASSGNHSEVMAGEAVSPGAYEGTVRVLHHPSERLLPGEVLVCESTNPAWTPHFLIAGALVMEVGGLMTHGSVVAREFGVPGVVGVVEATRRLRTGQRVRVDGNCGEVVVLE